MTDNAAMDETAQLCMSTLESILQTPAVEKRPFPGEIDTSLLRGSVPYETSLADPEDMQFNRTPRSSRRRGTRPRRKTRKSQNEDRESISPIRRPDELHVHEQGIDINVGNILRDTSSPKRKESYLSSTSTVHKSPDFPIYAPIPTSGLYTQFSPTTAPLSSNIPIFSEDSAFTSVKSKSSSHHKIMEPSSSMWNQPRYVIY